MSREPDGVKQQLILVSDRADLESELAKAGLTGGQPVIVLIGGAASLDRSGSTDLESIVRDGVIAAAQAMEATVIDGGTDSGVMALAGRGRAELSATIPLVGVAPIGRVAAEGIDGAVGTTRLEPNHTHLLLTPGDEWGTEVPWLMDAAQIISGGRPVVAVLIDGGDVAALEADEALAHGWPLIALAGSGRTADDLSAAARLRPDEGDAADGPPVLVRDVSVGGSELAATIRSLLGSRP